MFSAILCFVDVAASFLIPYVIILVLAGLPLFFLELALGQFSSLGPISVWKFLPLFKGIRTICFQNFTQLLIFITNSAYEEKVAKTRNSCTAVVMT